MHRVTLLTLSIDLLHIVFNVANTQHRLKSSSVIRGGVLKSQKQEFSKIPLSFLKVWFPLLYFHIYNETLTEPAAGHFHVQKQLFSRCDLANRSCNDFLTNSQVCNLLSCCFLLSSFLKINWNIKTRIHVLISMRFPHCFCCDMQHNMGEWN